MLALSNSKIPHELLTVDYFQYPGGEIALKKLPCQDFDTIVADLHSPADREALALLVDAIRRDRRNVPLRLDLAYVPYARQDRAEVGLETNEALSIRVFADFLNSLNFSEVWIADPHSDVTPALINNCHVVHRVQLITQVFEKLKTLGIKTPDIVLIAPDAGALKATNRIAQIHGIKTVLVAEKKRDMATGKIRGTVIHDIGQAMAKHVVIADDICDGGRTFIEIAKALNENLFVKPASMSLYVTHGIFSKGMEELLQYFDNIFCPFPFERTRYSSNAEQENGWDSQYSDFNTTVGPWPGRCPHSIAKSVQIIRNT